MKARDKSNIEKGLRENTSHTTSIIVRDLID